MCFRGKFLQFKIKLIKICLLVCLKKNNYPIAQLTTCPGQWRNRQDFWLGNLCWRIRKREARKIGKMEQKKGKSKKGRWKIENGRRKSYKNRWGPFFFTFHFAKRLKFVLGLPKWEFPTGQKTFHGGKKIRKNDFAPLGKKRPVTPLVQATTYCVGQACQMQIYDTKLAVFTTLLLWVSCRIMQLDQVDSLGGENDVNLQWLERTHITFVCIQKFIISKWQVVNSNIIYSAQSQYCLSKHVKCFLPSGEDFNE